MFFEMQISTTRFYTAASFADDNLVSRK